MDQVMGHIYFHYLMTFLWLVLGFVKESDSFAKEVQFAIFDDFFAFFEVGRKQLFLNCHFLHLNL